MHVNIIVNANKTDELLYSFVCIYVAIRAFLETGSIISSAQPSTSSTPKTNSKCRNPKYLTIY